MDTYSKLNGASPISPVHGRVWKIQKKRKMNDRQRRDEKKEERGKEEKEPQDHLIEKEQRMKNDTDDLNTEEQIGYYGTTKKKAPIKRKIDLTI
jgi:hypothetical protein